MEPLDQSKLTDHDILITLHNEVVHMGGDLRSMKDDMTARVVVLETKVDGLERTKTDRTEAEKLQRQVARLTNYLFAAAGGLAILQVAIQVYLSIRK